MCVTSEDLQRPQHSQCVSAFSLERRHSCTVPRHRQRHGQRHRQEHRLGDCCCRWWLCMGRAFALVPAACPFTGVPRLIQRCKARKRQPQRRARGECVELCLVCTKVPALPSHNNTSTCFSTHHANNNPTTTARPPGSTAAAASQSPKLPPAYAPRLLPQDVAHLRRPPPSRPSLNATACSSSSSSSSSICSSSSRRRSVW